MPDGHAGHLDRHEPSGGLPGVPAVDVPGGVASGDHRLPGGGLALRPSGPHVPGQVSVDGPGLPGAGNGEFGLAGWDGRVGGDGSVGLAQLTAGRADPGPPSGYRGSGYWPTGQYGPLPSQVSGSQVPRSGMGGMGRASYLGAMGGGRRGRPSGRRGPRAPLTEDERIWSVTSTAGARVVGLVDDEHPDYDEPTAPGDPGHAPRPAGTEETGQLVIGRGDDDQSEYQYEEGQQP
jgi:hypothetical protein